MKKNILILVLTLFLAVVLGGYVFAQAENPAGDLKAMLLSPTPGLYVSGWPAFSLSYPKDWQALPSTSPYMVFRVGAPRSSLPPSPTLAISNAPIPLPLDKLTSVMAPELAKVGKDVKVVSDKPTKLKDGTPAQEAEFEWVITNGPKINSMFLATMKEDVWIIVAIRDDKGKIGEDLKGILYSLKFQPGTPELVQVPPDVEQFFKEFGDDIASHDVEKVMTHFSDRYLSNGLNKQRQAEVYRQVLTVIAPNITFWKTSVTGFELQGDNAYVTGFVTDNNGKHPIGSPGVMIKEDGQWKWYGNQK